MEFLVKYTITSTAPESGTDSDGFEVSGCDIVGTDDQATALDIIVTEQATGMVVTWTGNPFEGLGED